jgi:antagonist of KipI
MAGLKVLRPGMLTTVQDLGRWGHQTDGVPVAGPMDPYSHRLANRLAANEDDAAAVEVTLVGPELEAVGDVSCAVAGAEFELTVDGVPVPGGRALDIRHGQRLRFGRRIAGARATLAVRGGIDVPPSFGSRATSTIAGMGPFGGRPLARGDMLPVGLSPAAPPSREAAPLPLPKGGARLRAMAGPHEAMFPGATVDLFFSARFTLTPSSNRMGYRLEGPPLTQAQQTELLSAATPAGSVQVPASGHPIVLMADRQTAGGYPRIATVISADIPLAGQLAPGDWVQFVPCTRSEAMDALRRLERRLTGRVS